MGRDGGDGVRGLVWGCANSTGLVGWESRFFFRGENPLGKPGSLVRRAGRLWRGKNEFVHICQVVKSGELTESIGIENGRSGQSRLLLGLIWDGESEGLQAGIFSEGRG